MSTRASLFSLAIIAMLGAEPALAVDGLRMPSNNIVCTVQDPDENLPRVLDLPRVLECEIRNFRPTKHSPPKDCHLGWGDLFSITENGRIGELECHGDTIMHEDVMVLPYGMTWRHGPFTCRSEPNGLTCFNSQGHGFSLSRSSQRVF
jgi:hypothetical protein